MRFLNPFWCVRTQQNWIVISFRTLVTKTDGEFCHEREAMLHLRSINSAASGSICLSAGRGWKSSKLLRNGYNLRLTLSYPDGWKSGLHVTNYLRRDPPTNSLTFHYRYHSFCLPFLLHLLFHSCQCAFFMMSRWESIRPETIYELHRMKYIYAFCLIYIYLLYSYIVHIYLQSLYFIYRV